MSSGPGSSDRSWIRLRINDNSSSNYVLEDEEIDVLLDDYGNKYSAAAACARSIGATFARTASTKTVGKLTIALASASQHHYDLAKELDREAEGRSGGAYAGGTSISDKEIQTDDTDWAGASFTRSQFDNLNASVNERVS